MVGIIIVDAGVGPEVDAYTVAEDCFAIEELADGGCGFGGVEGDDDAAHRF